MGDKNLDVKNVHLQGRSQGGGKGGRSPRNHSTIHFRKCSNLDKTLIGGVKGKRDHTLRKLWIDHLHKAGNCSLEALEFSIFLGCYLVSTPPPPAPPPQIRGLATPLYIFV